jgi:haloalkane dehalogenase
VLAFRQATPDGPPRGTLLCLHGYPQSSAMWEALLERAARAGWRAVAPDLPAFGDSPPDPPHTWERMVGAVARFHAEAELGPVALCVHDWGGLIGLRWACEHPGDVTALVISGTGFFPDGRWHGFAQALRTEGEGEELIGAFTRASFGQMVHGLVPDLPEAAVDEYFKAFESPERRRAHLELYRSGDFEKLRAYEGRLAAMRVPTLLLWGAGDPFAPVGAAHRFARELPGARLEILDDLGHFTFDEDPARTAGLVVEFLDSDG